MKVTLAALKAHAVASTFFKPTTLKRAVEKLGFVQADPIRSPARAQDLILRHRVTNYRAGDLERKYPKIGAEEDFLYAYGFLPLSSWRLLHPRVERALTEPERRVLELVTAHKRGLHPRELEQHLGREREVNAWGGYSKATTHILHALHYRGLLRVSGRENGIRVYSPSPWQEPIAKPRERLHRLVLLIARILQPVPERSLRATLRFLARAAPHLEGRYSAVADLVKSGELDHAEVEGVRYVWPQGRLVRKRVESRVRFLAPFDPLVWDRARFEHFWGWPYRFEAYTPPPKRKMGYYAMPLLWQHEVIGWVNIARKANNISAQAGFLSGKPKEPAFRVAYEEELEGFRQFLLAEDTSL